MPTSALGQLGGEEEGEEQEETTQNATIKVRVGGDVGISRYSSDRSSGETFSYVEGTVRIDPQDVAVTISGFFGRVFGVSTSIRGESYFIGPGLMTNFGYEGEIFNPYLGVGMVYGWNTRSSFENGSWDPSISVGGRFSLGSVQPFVQGNVVLYDIGTSYDIEGGILVEL